MRRRLSHFKKRRQIGLGRIWLKRQSERSLGLDPRLVKAFSFFAIASTLTLFGQNCASSRKALKPLPTAPIRAQ